MGADQTARYVRPRAPADRGTERPAGDGELPFVARQQAAAGDLRRYAGRRERPQSIRRAGQAEQSRIYVTDGIALGYRYDHSPIVVDDGSEPVPDTVSEYHPTTRPGSRAPHAWLEDGRSTLDLFGDRFVLLRFPGAPGCEPFEEAFARRGIPFQTITIDRAEIAALYERRLVLVRPDGHVAWRSETLPSDPGEIADRIRGVAWFVSSPR